MLSHVCDNTHTHTQLSLTHTPQDIVAFLPGELEQNKHKNPLFIKATTAPASSSTTCKRKRPRFTRKSAAAR